MRSRVSLSSALEKLNLFQLSALGAGPHLPERMRAFAFFVSQRLAKGGATKKLKLCFHEQGDSRTFEEIARTRSWSDVMVKNELTGKESDEELISRVGELCQPIVERFFPHTRLEVLADEFLTAGCICEFRPPKAGAADVAAEVIILHGMRDFEAFVDVQTSQGLARHRLLSGGAGANWFALMDFLKVTRDHVMIRSVPRMAYFPRWSKPASFFTGTAGRARRFVIDLERDGSQRVTQKWQVTGPGNKPIYGTELVAKNGTERKFTVEFNRALRRR